MDLAETSLVLVATILMIGTVILAFIPIMPGPMLAWVVSVAFAALSNFERMTPAAVVAATVVMVLGSTSDLWMSYFGVRTGGISCLSSVGAFVGGLVGTFFIPIPVVGSVIGSVAGAVLVEFVRLREMRRAMRTGQMTARMIAIGYAVQLTATLIIFAIYFVSVQSTV